MNRWPQFLKTSIILLFIMTAALMCSQAHAQGKSIVVASTTSTQDSGFFGYLLPIVKEKTGIVVKVLAQGTGQALDTARRGDANVVLVHAKSAEEKFLAEGWGVKRYPVMYNDFILIGPKDDPAGVKGKDILTALQTIKAKGAPFISRGDRSGTNIAELALWKNAGIDIAKDKGPWYKEIGQGMGAALNMASASNAYLLSDRGTWLPAADHHRGRNRRPHGAHQTRARRRARVGRRWNAIALGPLPRRRAQRTLMRSSLRRRREPRISQRSCSSWGEFCHRRRFDLGQVNLTIAAESDAMGAD